MIAKRTGIVSCWCQEAFLCSLTKRTMHSYPKQPPWMCAACLIGSRDFAHSGNRASMCHLSWKSWPHKGTALQANYGDFNWRERPYWWLLCINISVLLTDAQWSNSAISSTSTDQNEGFWRFSFLVLTLHSKVYFNFQAFLLLNEAGTLLVWSFRLSNLIFFQFRFTVGNYSPLSLVQMNCSQWLSWLCLPLLERQWTVSQKVTFAWDGNTFISSPAVINAISLRFMRFIIFMKCQSQRMQPTGARATQTDKGQRTVLLGRFLSALSRHLCVQDLFGVCDRSALSFQHIYQGPKRLK